MPKYRIAITFSILLLGASAALAELPSVERLEGVKIGGEWVEGVVLRGEEIPKHDIVSHWLGMLHTYHRERPEIYRSDLEALGIEIGTPAEAAVLEALTDPFFVRQHQPARVFDLSQPGGREAMERKEVDNAAQIGRIYGHLLRSLERAGIDARALDEHIEAQARESMSVTYMHTDDPSVAIRAQADAYRRQLKAEGVDE